MKRREFVEKIGIGSAGLVTGGVLAGGPNTPARAQGSSNHDHKPVKGSLANATVSFGQWKTDPPYDRYPNISGPPTANVHLLIPYEPTIKVGGAVNFVIAGLHQVIVYGPGTDPEDVNAALVRPMTAPAPPVLPLLINDPNNRVYAGLDPSLQPRDRVEVVSFPRKGRHLVICGVQPHFVNDHMFGWVKVVGGDHDD